MIESFSIWTYLIQIAPVVFVMSIAIAKLWKQYLASELKREEMNVENLKTLTDLANILAIIQEDIKVGNEQKSRELEKGVKDLKDHISERIDNMKDRL